MVRGRAEGKSNVLLLCRSGVYAKYIETKKKKEHLIPCNRQARVSLVQELCAFERSLPCIASVCQFISFVLAKQLFFLTLCQLLLHAEVVHQLSYEQKKWKKSQVQRAWIYQYFVGTFGCRQQQRALLATSRAHPTHTSIKTKTLCNAPARWSSCRRRKKKKKKKDGKTR